MNRLFEEIEHSALGPAQTEDDVITRRFRFAEGFVGYSGHFPGYAILPAVVQIQTALYLLTGERGNSPALESVENAKFLVQLRPGQDIDVECRWKSGNSGLRAEVRVTRGDALASSFTLRFASGRGNGE